jgi:long-chain acyl-CoA synthetase
VDATGFVYLHGRQDDMVNVGGFNVAPVEVESVLARHAAVAEAACVGVPDPRGIAGQVLRAFLVAEVGRDPVPDAELSGWLATELEPYKVPAQYQWVSKLPRTESGKLLRAMLLPKS